ncbi:hypothetical protein ACF0H5_020930 [Mactra antiquata]
MKLLVIAGLFSLVFLHFVAITTGYWYGVHVNINRCLSCGKLIITFGEHLENMTRLDEEMVNTLEDSASAITNNENVSLKFEQVRAEEYERRALHREADDHDGPGSKEWHTGDANENHDYAEREDLDDLKFVHDLTHSDYDKERSSIVEEFVIENYITVHVGLMKTRLCSEQNICTDFDHHSSSLVFEGLKFLRLTQSIIPWLKACICLATIVLMITMVCTIFHDIMPDLVISGLTMYCVFSLIAATTASFPYLTATSYDVITLCVPWAHVLTIVTSYISAVIVYQLQSNKQWLTKQKIPRWPMRGMKLV